MLARQLEEKFHCLLNLKKYIHVYSTTLFQVFGLRELIHLSNLLLHGYLMLLKDLNSCRNGLMKAHLPTSGFQVSSSPSHSWLVPNRTLLESTSLLLIRSTSHSLSSLMRPNITSQSQLKMVYSFMVSSLKDADGMKEKKLLKNPCQRFYTPPWSTFGCCQPRWVRSTMVIPTSAQFTRLQEELVLYQLQVIPQTSCSTFIFLCRRSMNKNIGLREVLPCSQAYLIDHNEISTFWI